MPIVPKSLYLPGSRAKLPRKMRWRKINTSLHVIRTGAAAAHGKAFEACVEIGKLGWRGWDAKKRASGFRRTCQFGPNPRIAIAKALAHAAVAIKPGKAGSTAHRRGAFARYR